MKQTEKTTPRCDQCESAYINGVYCHETGCPNHGSRYDHDEERWIKQRECPECGSIIDEDDECCNSEDSFMQPEIMQGHFQIIQNTREGDICIPECYSEYTSNDDAAESYGARPEDVSTVFGWGVRLSAAGYLDCTEWEVFDTEDEAIARGEEMMNE